MFLVGTGPTGGTLGGSHMGAALILARAAVAAYLNAAYDDGEHMKFPWRRYVAAFGNPPLIETVDAAFKSGSRSQMINLAKRLDKANNLGCPLS